MNVDLDKEQNNFLNRYMQLDPYKIDEIRIGLENGLSFANIELFADDKYNWQQMMEIRKGLEMKIHPAYLSVLLNESIPSWKMKQLILGIHNGLSLNDIILLRDNYNLYSAVKKNRLQMEMK